MSPQANWRDEHRLLVEKIQYIYLSGVLSNIVLTVKNGTSSKDFKAHSLFLAMASPVLEKMIGKQQAKSNKKTIEIMGVNPQVFESFLDYVYLEKVNWESFEQACELFQLAEKYCMIHLKELCEKYIRENIDGNTVCKAYEFAKDHDLIDLIETCKSIMQEKTFEVVTNSFFPKIQLTTLLAILEQNMLNISEKMLFKSVEFWIKGELERRGLTDSQDSPERLDLYNQIMPKIRFLSMTSQEFSEGPAESRMLSNEQMLAILLNISTSNTSFPMPQGFSMLKRVGFPPSLDNDKYFMWDKICNICTYKIHESLINIETSENIQLNGVMVKGQKVSDYDEKCYLEDFEVRIFDMATLKTISKTIFKEDIECSSLVQIKFPSPVSMNKGVTYQLGIYLNQPITRQYECVDLDGCVLTHKGIEFSFKKHLDWTHLIPIYGIILHYN